MLSEFMMFERLKDESCEINVAQKEPQDKKSFKLNLFSLSVSIPLNENKCIDLVHLYNWCTDSIVL